MRIKRRLGYVGFALALVVLGTWFAVCQNSAVAPPQTVLAPGANATGSEDTQLIPDGPGSAASARLATGGPEGPEAGAAGLGARLLFLRQDTRVPPEALSWAFDRDGGPVETLERELDAQGRCFLPPGRWRIRPLVAGFALVQDTVDLHAGCSVTVWVAVRSTLDVCVSGPRGLPVAGARVRFYSRSYWHPLLKEPTLRTALPAAEADTDVAGCAQLIVEAGQVGDLYALHPRYELGSWRLCSFPEQPLRLGLKPAEDEAIYLQLVASDDARPLSGLTVSTQAGAVDSATDAAGRIAIPAWAAGAQPLVASGPGVCRTRMILPEGEPSPRMPIARSARVRVRVSDPSAHGEEVVHLLFTLPDDAAQGSVQPELPGQLRLPPSGELEVELPRGQRTTISAFSSRGGSASRDLLLDVPRLEVTLILDEEGLLALSAADEAGEPVGSFQAVLTYDRLAEITLDSNPSGVAFVPMADRVDELRLSCRGYATAFLDAHPRWQASRAGQLRVVLERAHDVDLQLMDLQGRPLPGYLVTVSDQRRFQAYREHPDLGGAWPTAHPGWIQDATPYIYGESAWTTDAAGRVRMAGFAAGQYRIGAQIHPMLFQEHDQPFGSEERMSLELPAHEPVLEWRIAGMRRVTVSATIGTSGQPVDGLLVRSPDSDPGLRHEVAGSLWQGWVQEGKSLEVASEGLGSAPVPLSGLADEEQVDVILWPEQGHRLLLSGDLEGLSGAVLNYVVREPPSGLLSDPPVIGQGSVTIADPTKPTEVFLPYGEAAFITLEELSHQGGTWTFTPAIHSLHGKTDLPFIAHRVPGPSSD